MERTVEYRMPKCEFDTLVEYLNGAGKYTAHGYRGMPEGTIDDRSSTRFEDCRKLSTFQFLNGESVTLRIKEPQLAQTVDLYFANRQ